MTTRLEIYNVATLALGERQIDSLTEDREPRRIMDEIWNRGQGAVRYFLEQGHWNFAIRAQKWDKSATVEPEFGYTMAFEVPSDFIRLNMISSDENFGYPLTDFEWEGGYLYTFVDPVYLRFVSDDAAYGNDLSLWPETFTLWAGYWMATQAAPRLKNDIDMERLEKRARKYLVDARSKDAQQEPPRFPPLSAWNQSRSRWQSQRFDRGNRNKLIG
jgi:hypothetical protein